jgi:hypothetical protein
LKNKDWEESICPIDNIFDNLSLKSWLLTLNKLITEFDSELKLPP